MKQHLNTLFVTLEGAWLAKDGQAVDVRHERESKLRVPLVNLDGIVCLGWDINCSPQLMGACAEAGVTISFLNASRGRGLKLSGKTRIATTGMSPLHGGAD